MKAAVEIISKGRVVQVTEEQISQLQPLGQAVSWFRYCQLRLTKSHEEALEAINPDQGETDCGDQGAEHLRGCLKPSSQS